MAISIRTLQALWKLEPPLHSIITSGIDLILKQEYRQADSLFCEAINRFPQHPSGYLYRAAVLQAYAIDFDVPIEREKFDSLLECGRKKANELNSAWKDYFLGIADGYEAYERIERGDWFIGVRKGMASASKFEKIIEKDSSFYDAYVGIGTYNYWSSRKTAFLRWLPFIDDNREMGIQMLVTGADRSEYNRFAAMSALISIFLDAEDYHQAEEWSKRGLRSYPDNRIFLWGLATAFDRQMRLAEAVSAYTRLLENIIHTGAPHPYGEIVCRLNLVKSKLAIVDTTEVIHHLYTLLSYENRIFPDILQTRSHAKFEEARSLLSSFEKQRSVSK